MSRSKVFTLTSKDFHFEFFRAGGPGGQKQNKTSSAARCRHVPSGAVGESREHRTQLANKRAAFRRCAESDKFQSWCKLMVGSIDLKAIEKRVDEMMKDEHLLVEYL
jgi:hypothetical protein